MRAEKTRNSQRGFVLVLALAALLLASPSWAQQESSSAQPAANQPDQSLPPTIVTNTGSEEAQFREIGKAGPLPTELTSLRWGSLYLRSIEFLQIIDYTRRPHEPTYQRGLASLLRTNIVFDQRFRRSRLAFQYQPRMSFINGRLLRDYSSHNVNFDTHFFLTRRLSLAIHDEFNYYGNKKLFGDSYLSTDTVSGGILQSPFLDGTGRLISNDTSLVFGYDLSRRSRLTMTPHFIYYFSSPAALEGSAAPEPPLSHRLRGYGGTASLHHDLSDKQRVGVFYSFQRRELTGFSAGSVYQTLGASYAQRLSPTWRILTSLGGSRTAGETGRWTLHARLNLLKTFRTSSLTLAYSRSNSFAGYLSNAYHDRVDLSYGILLARRLEPAFGAGYHRELRSPRRISGKYANAGIRFRLFSSFSWFASYARIEQNGDGARIFSGKRNFLVTGFRWEPGPRARF